MKNILNRKDLNTLQFHQYCYNQYTHSKTLKAISQRRGDLVEETDEGEIKNHDDNSDNDIEDRDKDKRTKLRVSNRKKDRGGEYNHIVLNLVGISSPPKKYVTKDKFLSDFVKATGK